jgi:hypothetical protein
MAEGIRSIWLKTDERFGANESKASHVNGKGIKIELLGDYVVIIPDKGEPTLVPRENVRRIEVTSDWLAQQMRASKKP